MYSSTVHEYSTGIARSTRINFALLVFRKAKSAAHRIASGQVSRRRHVVGRPARGSRTPESPAAAIRLPHAHSGLPARMATSRAHRQSLGPPRVPRREPAYGLRTHSATCTCHPRIRKLKRTVYGFCARSAGLSLSLSITHSS